MYDNLQNTTQKTKDRATRTPLKAEGETHVMGGKYGKIYILLSVRNKQQLIQPNSIALLTTIFPEVTQ